MEGLDVARMALSGLLPESALPPDGYDRRTNPQNRSVTAVSTGDHERVRELIEAAQAEPTELRSEFVRDYCHDETTLCAEVMALLSHYKRVADFEPAKPAGSAFSIPGTTTLRDVQNRAQADATTLAPAPAAGPTVSLIAQAPPAASPADAAQPIADRAAGIRIRPLRRGPPREAPPAPPFCLDQYKVVEILGHGGMGVVYRAQHATLSCPVAIKLMRGRHVSAETQRRFALEVEILRQLRHPGICWLIHTGCAPMRQERDGQVQYVPTPYYVMEYVQGAPLHEYAQRVQPGIRERLRLLARICDAVDYAHRRGVIHRDLKPDNILVSDEGRAKILDFGVARLEDVMISVLPDEAGRFIGTPRYASPEQLAGRSDRLTARSDVFALGLIAHELLTGDLPGWMGQRVDLHLDALGADERRAGERLNLNELRFHVRELLAGALQADEHNRTPSAHAMAEQLRRIDVQCFSEPAGTLLRRLLNAIGRAFRGRPAPAEPSENRPLRAVMQARIRMGVEATRLEQARMENDVTQAL